MKRSRIIAGVVALAAVAAVGGGYAYSQANNKTTITTATVASRNLDVTVNAQGSVDAASTTSVFSPIAGTLATVKVADGQQVKAGDVLATLDTTSLHAAVAQAETQVSQADAQAKAADAQVESADAQSRAADNQLKTAKNLPSDTDALDQARTSAIKAAQAAQGQASAAQNAASAAQDAAQAAQDAAANALKTAQDNAAKGTINAPLAGTITLNSLTASPDGPKPAAGASVTTATPLFTLVDLSKLDFAAQVDEADIGAVKAGQPASVTLDAFPGRPFTGTVSEVSTHSVTTKTGGVAYVVKVPLTEGDATLRLGMSGDVTLTTNQVGNALVVPTQAVGADGAAKYVFKVVNGKVVKTTVTVGSSTDTQAQITSGLAAGDVVATSQLTALKDGASVNVGK